MGKFPMYIILLLALSAAAPSLWASARPESPFPGLPCDFDRLTADNFDMDMLDSAVVCGSFKTTNAAPARPAVSMRVMVAPVPEPATIVLLTLGGMGLVATGKVRSSVN